MRLKAVPTPTSPGFTRRTLEIAADELLATPRRDPREEHVRRRLAKQRDHLFTFLDHPDVPATNNLAERQLRPAVIARKLSCGNKNRPRRSTARVCDRAADSPGRRRVLEDRRGLALSGAPAHDAREMAAGAVGTTDTGRKARFYSITSAGRKQLEEEEQRWTLLTEAVSKALRFA